MGITSESITPNVSLLGASDENEESSNEDVGAFLSRTDTKGDHTKQSLREFNKDWVNFDDDGDDFGNAFFAKKQEEQSGIDAILFSSDNTLNGTQRPKKISKRIKGGLGNVWNKAKEKRKRVKLIRKNSKSETFGIDDVEPIQSMQTEMTPISTENNDFDPLSFFGSEKKKAPKSNNANQHKINVKTSDKAAAIFGDFEFSEDGNKKQSKQKQDTFGDLFGDLSSNQNDDTNTMPIHQKQSVKDLMQTAYKQPTKASNTKTKASNVFDDLFD